MNRYVLSARLSRRALHPSSALVATRPSHAAARDATPAALPSASPIPGQISGSDWPLYGADLADTRVAGETAISAANVTTLRQVWGVDLGGAVNGTPAIANGTVFIGSYTG